MHLTQEQRNHFAKLTAKPETELANDEHRELDTLMLHLDFTVLDLDVSDETIATYVDIREQRRRGNDTATEQPQDVLLIVDSRADSVDIQRTIVDMVGIHPANRILVDTTTAVGHEVAIAAVGLGIDATQTAPESDGMIHVTDESNDTILGDYTSGNGVAAIPARFVIVPAAVGAGEHHLDARVEPVELDLSPNTLPGLVTQTLMDAGRDMLLVDVPENGMVRDSDGSLRRRMLHPADRHRHDGHLRLPARRQRVAHEARYQYRQASSRAGAYPKCCHPGSSRRL